MRAIIPVLLCAVVGQVMCLVAGELPAAGKVSVSYDAKEDRSDVGFVDLNIYQGSDRRLTLNIGCGYAGKKPSPPDQCFVQLTSYSTKRHFPEHSTSYKVVGSAGLILEGPLQSYGYEEKDGGFVEPVITLWKFEQLQALAAAAEAELVLPDLKVKLRAPELEPIREVAKHFQ